MSHNDLLRQRQTSGRGQATVREVHISGAIAGPIPRTSTCSVPLPVTKNPAVSALSPMPTNARLEILTSRVDPVEPGSDAAVAKSTFTLSPDTVALAERVA